MIAFAIAVTKPDVYRRCAEVGVGRAAEPDSEVLALPSVGSIFASYNAILERLAGRDNLEALVLPHQDTEIASPDFCAQIRDALRDPDVAVLGCVGAIGVRSIAWWEGSVSLANLVHRYHEHGGGDLPAFSWSMEQAPPYARVGEVDTLDGFVLVLSGWAVNHLRFDETLGDFHGYDFDLCCQARAAGRKVATMNGRAIHHHGLYPFDDPEPWIAAHVRLAEKWDGRLPGIGAAPGPWAERYWRAQAARDAFRLTRHSQRLAVETRARELQREHDEMVRSLGWRLTAPLRRLARV